VQISIESLEFILKNKGECAFAQGRHPIPTTKRRTA
jgi:hypothetical protein